MHAKKWIQIFSILILLTVGTISIINFIVDPLWSFSHGNKFNKKQLYFNERQQKTNDVYFNGLDTYNSILIGSSRSTYVNQNDFTNMKIYNYSMESMELSEYEGYLNFARQRKGQNFQYIILGLDFYQSMHSTTQTFKQPSYYIENSKSLFYRYKMLSSVDTLKRSIKNISSNLFQHPIKYYTRNNVKVREKVSEKERIKQYTHHIKRHTNFFVTNNYKKDKSYISTLKKLKKENPNSKFIIFTSPITADLLVSIIKNADNLEAFENWLDDIIKVFGEVHHFMTINSITTNLQNYPDDDHLYPNIAKLLANKLSGTNNSDIPKDFGTVLTKKNIDAYMKVFKEQLKKYKNPLPSLVK